MTRTTRAPGDTPPALTTDELAALTTLTLARAAALEAEHTGHTSGGPLLPRRRAEPRREHTADAGAGIGAGP
ncbi:hypothetical protein ACN20G_35480 (plasmid) [Streptomyces sp. BI20]|uniref:hypothetical protein n=1 Tax=Streptomyces sp. BI20 TaxID=3403460 RepID=UPI003C78AA07